MGMRRRSSTRTASSGFNSEPSTLDFSTGDASASQQSLGEEGSTALVAFNDMRVVDDFTDTRTSVKDDTIAGESISSSSASASVAMPNLIVEGIVARDINGVFYTPQKYVFTYSSNNATHAKQVNDVLANALTEFNAFPECYANRFKCSPENYTGLLPSVVGGLSSKYKNKVFPSSETVPVAASAAPTRRKKRSRRD